MHMSGTRRRISRRNGYGRTPALCRAVGAEPFITINFNASPQLAADWVRYCNRERGYNVKYWEVGDEQWETWAKGHARPEVYAK